MKEKKKCLVYLRKSQDKKGQKHSIETQRDKINSFLVSNNMEAVGEFQDIESGKSDSRNGLLSALDESKKQQLPIVVWRVDRLGRKMSTLASIFERNDIPKVIIAELGMEADFMTLMILSVVAAQETRTLSRRVKESMAMLKARDPKIKFGNPRWEEKIDRAWEARREQGEQTIEKYGSLIVPLREDGLSYRKIASILQDWGVVAPSGKMNWSHASVMRIYKAASRE